MWKKIDISILASYESGKCIGYCITIKTEKGHYKFFRENLVGLEDIVNKFL